MSTIDSPQIISTMLANNGTYPGDPQVNSIWSYGNDWGKTAYKLIYNDPRGARLGEFLISPFCHIRICLWNDSKGLTEAGKAHLRSHPVEDQP